MKMFVNLMLVCVCTFLTACAVQPNDNYNLTSDEMKNAGNATMASQQNVPALYNHAEFAEKKLKGGS